MSNINPETVHTLAGPEALLGVIPPTLGFHPADSAVVVAIRGDRGRVGPIMRAALADLATHGVRMARDIAHTMASHADAVVIAIYGTDTSEPSASALLTEALEREGIPVHDVIHTGNKPHSLDPVVAAANALHGRATLRSREELSLSVQHQVAATLTDEDRATLGQISRTRGRDLYLADRIAERDPDAVIEVLQLVRATPDTHPAAANLCAAAAAIVYRNGDGALAHCLLDRAQTIQPGNKLTAMLRAGIEAGVHPDSYATLASVPR